jgi:FMN-dependent NADH-azoreductase
MNYVADVVICQRLTLSVWIVMSRGRMTSAKTSAEEAFQESVNQLARMLELVGVTTFEVVRERAGGSG